MYSPVWVNQFEMKDMCIEFVINNFWPQGNVKKKLDFKAEKICRDCSPNFLWNKGQRTRIFLALLEAYLLPCETPNMKCFTKIVNGWIHSTVFAESSILDFEYVSDYAEAFLLIINFFLLIDYY